MLVRKPFRPIFPENSTRNILFRGVSWIEAHKNVILRNFYHIFFFVFSSLRRYVFRPRGRMLMNDRIFQIFRRGAGFTMFDSYEIAFTYKGFAASP